MNPTIDSPLARAKDRINIFALGPILFPGWKAGRSCRSPFREDRHPSFSVFDEGRVWKDHGTGEFGDVVDFIAKARGISISDSARELIALADTGAANEGRYKALSPSPVSAQLRAAAVAVEANAGPLPAMPADCQAVWDEGVSHLRKNESMQHVIDAWRCWPEGTARQLAEGELMGCPIVNGARLTSFAVQEPRRDEFGFVSTRDAGFHVRRKPSVTNERATWTFMPNERAHGVSVPALPFVLGGGFVPFAHTIVCCEGQWDAVCLAAAAGWLASDGAWPERIAVFGTRGVGAWRPLIQYWGRYWLPEAKFVLFADADEAGAGWKAPGGFCEALLLRGHHVRIIRSGEAGAKDLNDLHRQQALSAGEISEWIAPKGVAP